VNDRLYRSVDDRVLGGVCAGLADRLDLDPALVRVGYAILALVTGIFPLLVLYVIMVVVIPEEPGWAGVQPVGPQPTGASWPPVAGASAGAPPAEPTSPDGGTARDAAAPAGVQGAQPTPNAPGGVPGWIAPGSWNGRSWRDQRRADRAARHADRATRRAERRTDPLPAVIAGLFLVVLGAFFLVRNTFNLDWAVVWPVIVIAFGLVVLVAAVRPRSG
jgi:phage shock protein C